MVKSSSSFTLLPVIDMSNKRHVEIFSAGCDLCQDLIEKVRNMACSSCEIDVLDLSRDENVIHSAPAVAVDGQPVACCKNSGPDLDKLRAAGIGTKL